MDCHGDDVDCYVVVVVVLVIFGKKKSNDNKIINKKKTKHLPYLLLLMGMTVIIWGWQLNDFVLFCFFIWWGKERWSKSVASYFDDILLGCQLVDICRI